MTRRSVELGWPADPDRAALMWSSWVGTRLIMVALVVGDLASGRWRIGTGVSGDLERVYGPVHLALTSGRMPYRDFPHEYPPGDLLQLALPPVPGLPLPVFFTTWLLVSVGLDLLVLMALRRLRPGVSQLPAWAWIAVGPLMGGLSLVRNDLLACALVAWAFVAFVKCRPLLCGALLTAGAAVKVWPVIVLALLFVSRPDVRRHLLTGSALAGTAVAAPLVATGLLLPAIRSVVGYHGGRGVQIEAPAALPALLRASLKGLPSPVASDHGSSGIVGSVSLGQWCTAVSAAALIVILGAAARRARGAALEIGDVALLATGTVALLLTTGKVLSPQYMLWLATLSCIAAGLQSHSGTLPLVLTLQSVLLTGLEYPNLFGDLQQAALLPIVILVLRDALLLLVSVLCLRRLAARWPARDARVGGQVPDRGSRHLAGETPGAAEQAPCLLAR